MNAARAKPCKPHQPPEVMSTGPQARAQPPHRAAGAFTLIEVMVVITVLTVLVAISASALGRARESADRTHSLAKLRDLATRFGVYYAEFSDTFPYSTRDTLHPLTRPGDAAAFGHFQIDINWPLLMPDLVAAARTPSAPHLAPKATRRQSPSPAGADGTPLLLEASYVYGLSFVADPALWVVGTPRSESLLRAVKVHEAVFPSRKALLWDAFTPYLWPPPGGFTWNRADPIPMLFVDGHAAQLAPADAQPGAPCTAFPTLPVGGKRLSDTPGGVRGYDY